jgi:hypothetical protein
MRMLLMLLRRDVHQLEYDPAMQYRFHFALTWFWFLTMVALPFVPVLWGHTLPALVVQEISLWANFATHFGSMSSALAAQQTTRIPTDTLIVDRTAAAIDDIAL